MQAGVIGKDDGRLLKARGESKLSRREVLGAAGIGEVNLAVYDLDIKAGGHYPCWGRGRDLRDPEIGRAHV